MFARGARNFVFLWCSGSEKSGARQFLYQPRTIGLGIYNRRRRQNNRGGDGYEGRSHIQDDPRISIMVRALFGDSSGSVSRAREKSPGSRQLPKSIVEALAAEKIDCSSLIKALRSIVGQDISNLLLLLANQLDAKRYLTKI